MLQDFYDRGIYLTEDEYRGGLRTLFPEEYQEFSDEQLEDILYDRIAQLSPSEAEGFFSSVGDFFKTHVAPVAIAVLPAVTSIAGTAIGGPIGAAAGNALGGFAANAISGATKIKPNPLASNIGQAATSIAGGNIGGAIPNLINAGRGIGNTISPGAGNTIANVAQGILPVIGVANTGSSTNQTPSSSQLLSFLRSTPFLQSMLATIATGNMGTGLQIPKEDGSVASTNYLEMLESLKHLTENAIIEADNMGFSNNLQIESEADKDAYIEALIENVNSYENSLLPNYDNIQYN